MKMYVLCNNTKGDTLILIRYICNNFIILDEILYNYIEKKRNVNTARYFSILVHTFSCVVNVK